jgi:hypothetical protein
MTSALITITQDRAAQRAEVAKSGSEAQKLNELRYIADALEGIRRELSGLSDLVGRMARTPPK